MAIATTVWVLVSAVGTEQRRHDFSWAGTECAQLPEALSAHGHRLLPEHKSSSCLVGISFFLSPFFFLLHTLI